MKEFLTVNLEKFHKIAPHLDLIDAAIFDYIYHYCASRHENVITKRNLDGFTWIDYESLMDNLPYLHINNTTPISRRMDKLEQAGLITRQREGNQKIFVDVTPVGTRLYLKP